ncbi:MAG: ComF family protein [Burkholderiales bacterium]|nr:MAG: ComF family protein [Burkholderiales bacterium]
MSTGPILRAAIAAVGSRLADDWLAPSCALCGLSPAQSAAETAGLCSGCAARLPGASEARCSVCAEAVQGEARRCARCARLPAPFDGTLTLGSYAPPLDRWITALKFGRDPGLARPLGELLAARLQSAGLSAPDLLVPVPLGSARLRARGFNQALEIARPIGRALGRAPQLGLLRRRRETAPQSSLTQAARIDNLERAFDCTRPLAGARVAVVDDVMTTGATLSAVAQALKRAGAGHVLNLVACRA